MMSAASGGHSTVRAPSSAKQLLVRVLGRNARGVAASFALLSVWQISEALVPVVGGELIDHAVSTGSLSALAGWGALLVLVFASLTLVYRYGASIAYRVDQQERDRLRIEIAGHVLRPRGARTGQLPGATLSMATADTESVGSLTQSAGYTFASAMAVAVSAAVLLQADLVIGLTVLFGVPLVLALTQLATPLITRRSRDQRARVATISGTAADLVRGLRVIKGIAAEDEAVARYSKQSQVAKVADVRLAGSQALLESLSTGLRLQFLASVTALAGSRALDHTISIGQLIAIVGLTQFLTVPIRALSQAGGRIAAGYASAARIVEFLHTPPLLAAGDVRPPADVPSISLRNVSTGALKEFSLDSHPGEMMCLVMDDPAAAGTLVRMLTGEMAADHISGDARLNGESITELSVQDRNEILLVNPHQIDLLQGTLRSNIDPKGRYADADLVQFLDCAAATDIVHLHEHGLDQPVAPSGCTYSGGQRQRIALARALSADASILVLDNPTTGVDAVTEQRIAIGVKQLRHSPSSTQVTWIITTSPALLAQANRVVHVADGRIVNSGTQRELLRQPAYREFVLR